MHQTLIAALEAARQRPAAEVQGSQAQSLGKSSPRISSAELPTDGDAARTQVNSPLSNTAEPHGTDDEHTASTNAVDQTLEQAHESNRSKAAHTTSETDGALRDSTAGSNR